MRQYESVLIQRETEALEESLAVDNARTESLARAGRLMRAVMRRLGGEDVHAYEAYQQAMAHPSRSENTSDASTSNIPYEVDGTGSGTVEVSDLLPELREVGRVTQESIFNEEFRPCVKYCP